MSISFDNSKDRTFADWAFTNTGRLALLLKPGEVPSMDVGQAFLGENVTHKAEENIEITKAGKVGTDLQRQVLFWLGVSDTCPLKSRGD